MNIIIFGLLLSVVVVYGSEESCQESRQLESICGTYCHKVLKIVLEHTKALERQLTNFKPEEKCLSENKFDSQEKKTEQKFKDLDIAIESILQQIKLQGKQFEQQLDHLYKAEDKKIEQKLTDLSTASEQIMEQTKLQGKQFEQQLEHLQKAEEVKKQIPGPPYQQIGSKYYYIEESEELSWFEAVNKCDSMDGHLVSIQNVDEFNAIKQKLQNRKDYWIDISGFAKKNEYTSISTGRRVNYFKWAPNEPDELNGDQNCVELHSLFEHQMFLFDCSSEQLFICEFGN